MEKAECLFVGEPQEYGTSKFDAEQLTALAQVDNFLMKYSGFFQIVDMEVYSNGCINLKIKNQTLGIMAFYVTIRPSIAEKAHYDQLAREHGFTD